MGALAYLDLLVLCLCMSHTLLHVAKFILHVVYAYKNGTCYIGKNTDVCVHSSPYSCFQQTNSCYTIIDVTKLTIHMPCAYIKKKVHVALVCSLIYMPIPNCVHVLWHFWQSNGGVYTLDVTKPILHVI